jgi:gliding motility-associated-like protein
MRFPVTILQEPSVSCAFTANTLSGCSPVTVDFTNTSSNGTSYLWNFGDFNSDTTTNPVHTFDSSGTFIVKLITINNSSVCGIVRDTATTTITVYPQAHASFTADTLTGCSPFTVHFINNSNNATSYLWNLGNNNTSTATNPSFTYDTSGSYTITLIAYSTGGCNDTMIQTNYITINTLPTVSSYFVADTFSGCNPLTVNFINTSNNGTSYQWNFGDSSTINTINATHTYTDSGTFKVILVATNTGPCGVVTDTSTQQTTIRVDEPIKVTSSFTAEPLSGCSPLAVTFLNSSINGANYYWYFGDGGFDSMKNPVHIYDSGSYHVYLIAYNNTNRCTNSPDSTGLLITVDNCELSIPNVFSPNGDGKNDFFNLIAEGYTNFHLFIFNRWGLKIFESSDASNQWNGRVNNTGGECPDGTYYYIFTANDINRKPLSEKGFITLMR